MPTCLTSVEWEEDHGWVVREGRGHSEGVVVADHPFPQVQGVGGLFEHCEWVQRGKEQQDHNTASVL